MIDERSDLLENIQNLVSECSYSHEKEAAVINERSDLLENIQNLVSEISNLQKNNNNRINILAKLYLKELQDMKENYTWLQNSINELEVKLATRDEKLEEAISNNVKPLQVVNEKINENFVNSNFNCKLCG